MDTKERIMSWDRLLSAKRFGLERYHDAHQHTRTDFQRDYDRLVFSSPFRRLQNKTQVFLPGSVFVHNRLTHSLEVSCVGRSLGNDISAVLGEKYREEPWSYKFQGMGAIVAAACLAHDLGNPPFGHSGERAIATYFSEGNGQKLRESLSLQEKQWKDLIHFEGNANAFRLLTHRFKGRREGGFVMTYSTLASIVKYPYESILAAEKGKLGFFTSECDDFIRIADELSMLRIPDNGVRYCRHPLVYLVEAADDICYQIMDIEDAHKLKILTTDHIEELFLAFFTDERRRRIEENLRIVSDLNEQVAYLRSCVIGKLVEECSQAFIALEDQLLHGTLQGSLIEQISEVPRKAYEECSRVAYQKIYKTSDVLDIELAGNCIITLLLDKLIDAVLHPEKAYSQLLLNKVPSQYEMQSDDVFTRIQAVIDYISGMTDIYALELYRKITGMSLPVL
ncbi:MAG: dNTP triphosphohydrolase [Porphyromonadaceae bacterium]|nr:dNTP triphosphohydrolase [Porphyromonadaceae bacterium]